MPRGVGREKWALNLASAFPCTILLSETQSTARRSVKAATYNLLLLRNICIRDARTSLTLHHRVGDPFFPSAAAKSIFGYLYFAVAPFLHNSLLLSEPILSGNTLTLR
jgi:hypothetical protein